MDKGSPQRLLRNPQGSQGSARGAQCFKFEVRYREETGVLEREGGEVIAKSMSSKIS